MVHKSDMKESIFVFIYGYLPGINYGGPVTSIYNFAQSFGDKYDIRIVCSDHDHGSKVKYSDINIGWNKVGCAQVLYLPEKEYSERRFFGIMKEYKVIMVYLTGVFSYRLNHSAIKASKSLGIPVVLATRGELCANILKMKSYKKLPYLFVMKIVREFENVIFQVTSKEEHDQLEKYLRIPNDSIVSLPNISGASFEYTRPLKKSGYAKFLFISRIHPKKNLLEAIQALKSVNGNVEFDIYGPIEDATYWKKCCEEIKKLPNNVQAKYNGNLDTENAKKIYYRYHYFIFPTLSENYGHVIVESLIAKCPVLLSRGTTPWDDINNQAGIVVDLHDINAMTVKMDEFINMNQEQYDELIGKLINYVEQRIQVSEVLSGYNKLIERCKGCYGGMA